jgi:FKBP-type peptidyl-prolyl cis-trans isomerase (trigger factor)
MKAKYKAKIEKLDKSRVKVTVTVPHAEFEKNFENAKTKVLAESKLNGFRDGKVPYEAFVKAYGELPVRQEMGYMCVDQTYVEVIIGEKIEAIGRPEIAITKIIPGEDFEYEFSTDVLPKVEIGKYKTYSKKIEEEKTEEVTDEEVNNSLEELRRMRAKGEELPEVNAEFLKSVGNFANVDELKAKIKEGIVSEKKWRQEEKRKGQILDLLVSETKTDIPNSLVENELAKIEDRIISDLAQMGVSFEDYLKHLKKTKAEWQESERKNAEKQVVIQLALHAISKEEGIKVSEETVKNEVAHLIMHYKDLDPERARAYTEERMTNSMVAEFLFTGKVPDEKELFGSHEGHNH